MNSFNSTALLTTGSRAAARCSPPWACRTTLPAKSSPLGFSRRKPPRAISACYKASCAATASPSPYGDRSSVFTRNDDHWSIDEQLAGQRQPTQFGRALEQLGVTFIAAQTPQAQGRIERLWGLLQDRLTSELRLAQAADLDAANAVLQKFVADYNCRFARTPRDAEKAWRPAPQNLERICCCTHERIVGNDNVVQWDGQQLQIHPQPRRFSFAGAKVQICHALDGRVSLYYRDTRLEHSNLAGG